MAEKKQTLKSVQREIEKLNLAIEKSTAKIMEFKEKIKTDRAELRKLLELQTALEREEMQNKITAAWFKEGRLTDGQILKFLELSKQINGKIDILDVEEIVKAVEKVCDGKQADGEPSACLPPNVRDAENKKL
jgi:hypothetical protein